MASRWMQTTEDRGRPARVERVRIRKRDPAESFGRTRARQSVTPAAIVLMQVQARAAERRERAHQREIGSRRGKTLFSSNGPIA